MSSRRNYSKESRSYYSRSSSYENRSSNSSYRHRPLSSLLIERDFSSPSLALVHLDDLDFFQRRSRRFKDDFDRRIRSRFNRDEEFFNDDEDFFRNNLLDFQRSNPINTRTYQNSSSTTRNIPVQYTTSSRNQREKVYKKLDNWSTNSFENQNFNREENRISTAEYPPKQESPTRKRTSMTIFVRQPRVQYSDVGNHQRTISTPSYSSTIRTNYY